MKKPMVRITVVNSLCGWMKQQMLFSLIYVGNCCCRATLWYSVMLAAAVPSPTRTMLMKNLSQCVPVSPTRTMIMKNTSWGNLSDKGPLPQTAKSGAAVATASQQRSTMSSSAAEGKKGSASQPPIFFSSWCCPVTPWRKPFSTDNPFWTWRIAISTASCVTLLTSNTFSGALALLIWKTEPSSQAAAGGKLEILTANQATTILVLRNKDVAQLELTLWLTLDI